MKILFAVLFFPLLSFSESNKHPFDYDLHLSYLPHNKKHAMICFHEYGDSYKLALSLKELDCIDATLVSFNFPEHDMN